jgi:hypothetical protein
MVICDADQGGLGRSKKGSRKYSPRNSLRCYGRVLKISQGDREFTHETSGENGVTDETSLFDGGELETGCTAWYPF